MDVPFPVFIDRAGTEAGGFGETGNELFAAIRISGVIHTVHSDKNIVGIQNFAPGGRQRQKNHIAGRDIGYRHPAVAVIRHIESGISQR